MRGSAAIPATRCVQAGGQGARGGQGSMASCCWDDGLEAAGLPAAVSSLAFSLCPLAPPTPPPCTAVPLQVRSAYRLKGWALQDLDKVEQCHAEGYKDEVGSQKGEGCHLWGDLHINKVRVDVCVRGRACEWGVWICVRV